jgi:hypothetical protein
MDMGKIKIGKVEGCNSDEVGRVYLELKDQKVEISDSDLFLVFSYNKNEKDKLFVLSNANELEEYHQLRGMLLLILDKWKENFGKYEMVMPNINSCCDIIRDHKNKK